MIDWGKPLECKSFVGHTIDFIGFTPDGFNVVVQSYSGALYKVNRLTGVIVNGTCKIQNKKEPWEVAWEKHKEDCNPMFYREEDYFKKVFELGRTWDQNKKF
jgi:hypothetical protein